ncbi:MAG TPA: FAD-dependent monooxygenase [Gammaproteobacteria bacterium]|jgi:2-octaprenyl-6-methoxyphenol hydroxylase|nr:FAD-dependent monooxygenase [Gammaproteobacteria bacterium]
MTYDIAIIGGGMVGLTLAIALQKNSRVLLIDAVAENKEDHRLIALNHSSICLFKSLHVWPMLQSHATPINEIHVSKRGRLGITRISSDLLKLETLGYVIPAKYINIALSKLLKVDVIRPGILKKFHQTSDEVFLTVETSEGLKEISASYMIGADGTHSFVREFLNIPTKKIDYQQSAIVTKTLLHRPHQNVAYERFVEEGAIAMLPLQNNEVATIWTANNSKIDALLKLSDEEFLQTLQKTFGYRLGRLQKISKRYSYPLHLVKATEHQIDRIILMGNALHTMQPIAAQSLNLAFYEMTLLVEYFAKKSQEKIDFSKHSLPEKLSHHLSWIFSTDFFLWNMARQSSMIALDVFPILKKYFLKRLMRGV